MQLAVLAKLSSALAFVRGLVRWDDWYDTKVPLFLVCMYYAALSSPRLDARLVGEMTLLLALLCGYASFGHMINDLADRAADRAAGKRNVLARLSERRARMLVLVAGVGGLLPAIPLYFERPEVIAFIGAAYILATLYSLPPARLKERGVLGLVAAALAQRTLPALIVFDALGVWDWTAAALCTLSTLVGLRYILVHQIADAQNDARAGIRTFGTEQGQDLLSRLISRVVFPLELASLGFAVLTMGIALPSVWALTALYAVWLEVQRRRFTRLGLSMSPISYGLLAEFYFVYWPLLLATVLSIRGPVSVPILALTILWLFPGIRVLIGDAVRLFGASAGTLGEAKTALVESAAGGILGTLRSERPTALDANDGKSWSNVRRNQPCPCGSGKRYKHCHGRYANGLQAPNRCFTASVEADQTQSFGL